MALDGNQVRSVQPLSRLVRLEELFLGENGLGDEGVSHLASVVGLRTLSLRDNHISDIGFLAHLTRMRELYLGHNNIGDISPLKHLTMLQRLHLQGNNISDVSPLVGLTALKELHLAGNPVSDISPLYALLRQNPDLKIYLEGGKPLTPKTVSIPEPVNIPDPNLRAAIEKALGKASGDTITASDMAKLTRLEAQNTNISDLTGLEHATNLTELFLWDNNITDISVLSSLTNLTVLWLMDNNISDLSPLVANTGLGKGDTVDVSENPLSYQSINTHIPTLQRRGVEVIFKNLKPTTSEYTLSIPAGTSLIHVPLKVTAVDGVAKTVTTISNLYDALGGVLTVNFLMTYDSQQGWIGYWGASDAGTPADRTLTDDIGIIAGIKAPVSLRLSGTALGTNGNSTITLTPGLNLVGIPLRDERINRVSDLLRLDGIWGNVSMIILTEDGDFQSVGHAGDPGDVPITGGQGFILMAQQAAQITISGEAWTSVSETAAAPLVTRKGIKVGDATPVLALRGSVVDEEAALNTLGFRVTVKNLSSGRTVTGMTKDEGSGYRLTVVDIEKGRAAAIGDTLEISAQALDPFIDVTPLRYTVTAEDVRQSWIQLPALVAYEIPAETELLANYPNPFNPETWIPYRLAEDAFVTLTIYDLNGHLARTLDVGHRIAAAYESRSKAIYWDGRNDLGEPVASGIYFYTLTAGDFSATRRMVILK